VFFRFVFYGMVLIKQEQASKLKISTNKQEQASKHKLSRSKQAENKQDTLGEKLTTAGAQYWRTSRSGKAGTAAPS
jgi:hypothetical protein